MSVFDQPGPPLPGAVGDSGSGDGQESTGPGGPGEADAGAGPAPAEAIPSFDPHQDAREIVRLVQCERCSLPLRQPMTLACGNSLCRRCLPELYKRENITYPAVSGRSEGFLCPFAECQREHSMGDCSNDVTLSKLLEQVSIEIARYRPLTSDTPMLLDERPHPGTGMTDPVAHSRVLHGGRLVATFTMAELGELAYRSEVTYQTRSATGDTYQHLDYGILEHLREVTRSELDCHVCFALMLDPLTLACGHTFCRKCVARVLDHAQKCPACRRPLILTPGALQAEASNKRLSKLLLALCPDQVAARVQQVEAEETELAGNQQIPLFICTLAYPRIPTFLRIFEPRYRLMIRRAMESDRKFGMLAYNARGEAQGNLGVTQFLQYGTLLEIVNMHMLRDGCSVIETVGLSRFRVIEQGMRDGYTVGRVERIDDIPVAEEEAFEAEQVAGGSGATAAAQGTAPGGGATTDTDSSYAPFSAFSAPSDNTLPPLETMPTTELMEVCTAFIRRMRQASAHWLSDHIIEAYGPMPDDPAVFPYWFASVLPINEAEKYRLLPTRSVRARLMICAEWVRRVERTRWYARLRELVDSGSPAAPASSPEGGDEDDGHDGDGEDAPGPGTSPPASAPPDVEASPPSARESAPADEVIISIDEFGNASIQVSNAAGHPNASTGSGSPIRTMIADPTPPSEPQATVSDREAPSEPQATHSGHMNISTSTAGLEDS